MAGENRKTKEELIEELAESQAEYRLALDAMFDALHVVDRDFRFVVANRRIVEWADMLGLSTDFVGNPLSSVFTFLPEKVWEEYRKVFETGESMATEEATTVGDRMMFTETTKVPIIEGGEVTKVMTVIHDVTERRHIEDALRESEEKFRTLAEESPNMIFIMVGGGLVYVNQRTLEVLGYTREEFYSPEMNVTALTAPDHLEKTSQAFARYLEGQTVEPFECALLTKGDRRIDAIVATRIVDYSGQKALFWVITDISARKAAEEALRASEEKYRTFVENFHGIAYRGALDGAPIFFEGDVERMTGYTEDDFLAGKPRWEEIAHPDDRAEVTRRLMLDGGEGDQFGLEKEYRIIRKDGRALWVHQSVRPVRDESGTPIFVQGAIYDITDRKYIEEARDRERKAFRVIADAASRGEDTQDVCRRVLAGLVKLLDFEFGIIRLYDAEHQVLRLAASIGLADEVVRDKIKDQPIESTKYVAAHVARTRTPIFAPDVKVSRVLRAFGWRITEMNVQSLISWPLLVANGDLLGILHLFSSSPKDIPEGDRYFFETMAGMLCVVLDRKRTEEALQESETRYRHRFEVSPTPMWEANFSSVKECVDEITSRGAADLGAYLDDHPEALERCVGKTRMVRANRAALEALGVDSLEDFRRIPMEFTQRMGPAVARTVLLAVAEGRSELEIDFEMPIESGANRWVKVKWSAFWGYEETLSRVLVTLTDLGDRTA